MAKKALTISDALQGYMMRCQSKGYTLKTQQWYEQKLRYFCSYMEAQQKTRNLKEVTLLHLRSFIVFVQSSKVDNSDGGGIKPRKDECPLPESFAALRQKVLPPRFIILTRFHGELYAEQCVPLLNA